MSKTIAQEKDEQDSPWKQILNQYLQEAVEFFFPDVAEIVDWSKAPTCICLQMPRQRLQPATRL